MARKSGVRPISAIPHSGFPIPHSLFAIIIGIHFETCAENDAVVLPVLLYGTADVALGLGEDLQRIARALREKFPGVLIRIRADSGYAKPWLYRLCERLDRN